jgi:multidrug efflux pump subunit AcrA (membrane-fusion protein)
MSVGDAVVIDQGLSAGERVVTEGQLRLVPGAKVQISS